MNLMIWFLILLGAIYFFVIAFFFYGWEKLAEVNIHDGQRSTFVSIIVSMRNEEENIANLLHDLQIQTYPSNLYEIIIVDDHSHDQSSQIASKCKLPNCNILTLSSENSGKKAALNHGIKISKGELIITTDADCRMQKNWISSIVSFYEQTKSVMIMAPVLAYNPQHSIKKFKFPLLQELLNLEFFSLLGSTAGSASSNIPIMCNGANLVFTKSVYPDIEHIYRDKHIASGDDIFAMLELKKKYPGRIRYLKSKEAAVYSTVPSNISLFFQQRSRWASKSKFYKDPFIIITALTVFGINFALLNSLAYGIIQHNFFYFLMLLLIKSIIDFPFLYRVTSFFGQERLMLWFPIVQILYFLYVCITVFIAIIFPISWKERRI
jgi:cellulose synthase/poly-beta-1,6-N-acetylglucosamine synthase-like glycosyltransferase